MNTYLVEKKANEFPRRSLNDDLHVRHPWDDDRFPVDDESDDRFDDIDPDLLIRQILREHRE